MDLHVMILFFLLPAVKATSDCEKCISEMRVYALMVNGEWGCIEGGMARTFKAVEWVRDEEDCPEEESTTPETAESSMDNNEMNMTTPTPTSIVSATVDSSSIQTVATEYKYDDETEVYQEVSTSPPVIDEVRKIEITPPISSIIPYDPTPDSTTVTDDYKEVLDTTDPGASFPEQGAPADLLPPWSKFPGMVNPHLLLQKLNCTEEDEDLIRKQERSFCRLLLLSHRHINREDNPFRDHQNPMEKRINDCLRIMHQYRHCRQKRGAELRGIDEKSTTPFVLVVIAIVLLVLFGISVAIFFHKKRPILILWKKFL